MTIKTLAPLSFGRFQNRELRLSPGINLIEAPNEAGKSTLAAFVSGMLYGFFRRDVKRRMAAPNYDRYLPWDNPKKYFGWIELTHEGREYRLERNFIKDDVKLFDAETGRDVSEEMPYNALLRIREPGQFFLGISQTAFEGTLYVPQQAVRECGELGKELGDRIGALSQAGAGALSASGAVRWLNEKRDKIGTPGRSGSPLGGLHRKLSELAAEREESERKRALAAEDAARERELAREIEDLEAQRRQDQAALEQARRYARWRRAEDARALKANVDQLERALHKLPEGGEQDEARAERALQDARQAEELSGQAEEAARTLSELDGRIRSARERAEETGLDDEKCALAAPLERAQMRCSLLADDLNAKREAERAARHALPSSPAANPERAQQLMARCEALPCVKPARWSLVLDLILTILALAGFAYPLAFLLIAPAAALMIFGILRSGKRRRVEGARADILKELGVPSPQDFPALRAALEDRARAERALAAASEAAASARAALESADREFSDLLARAGVETSEEFGEALARYEAALEEARAQSIRRGALMEQQKAFRDQAELRERSVRQALKAAGLDESLGMPAAREMLGEYLKQLRARRETARALEDAKKLLARCLDGDDYEALVTDAAPEPEPPEPIEALAAAAEARGARIQSLSRERAACAARRDAIEDNRRAPGEIDGEMLLIREKIDRLTLEAEALDMAREHIERAADDMRRKLSPALGRAIAQVSGQVTSGRYDQLRIDTDLKVQALSDGHTLPPESLSGGTADAIYLALRLGLVEFLMGDKECPVILDDSLAQLDDARAERMLQVIAEFSEKRQALLLTCQSRTRRMLEALGIPHQAAQL